MSPLPNLVLTLEQELRAGRRMPFPFDSLAAAAVPFFEMGMQRRLRGPRTRVEARVISFGNLTTGGTGKTPAVIARAQEESAAGRQVAVLTRGYGSRRVREPFVAEPGAPALESPFYQLVGDEPALIRMKAPQVTIVKSADRVAGAQAALAAGCDTILLDDGFQAVALERDENILLVDATNPFGNGHLVPRGMLRERIEAAARATDIILTRCDQMERVAQLLPLDTLETRLRAVCPHAPITRTRHVPTGLWNLKTGERETLARLPGRTVAGACGIGNPEAFRATLEATGAIVDQFRHFPDHAQVSFTDLRQYEVIVVTEKDAVRLERAPENVWALEIQLQPMDWGG